MDIIGNVIPFIGGEEEKMQQETQKILGHFAGDRIEPLAAKVSAHCNRVAVVDGHTVTVSVEFSVKPTEADLRNAFETFSSVPQERNLPSAPKHPGAVHDGNRPSAAAQRCRTRPRHGGIRRAACAPARSSTGSSSRSATTRYAEQPGAAVLNAEADALGRACLGLDMIVMKFGGTSVESAAAIERVASIVKSRVDRNPIVVVSAMGKTTNKLLAIAQSAIDGKRDEYIRQLHDLRDFHSAKPGRWCRWPIAPNSTARWTSISRRLTELVKGIAVLGELTPRSIDAISSYGERLSSYIVALAFEHFGLPAVHVDSRRVIVTDHRHTQAAPLFTKPTSASLP